MQARTGLTRAARVKPLQWQLAPRPAAVHAYNGAMIAAAVRPYATMPNQQQVANTFAAPFKHFLSTLSRIARIIAFTAAGIAVVGIVGVEGTHLYVEHIGMPRLQIGRGILDDRSDAQGDPWSWKHDYGEEEWVGKNAKGTDPRLGFVGRHQLRAAWISAQWGGGIRPSNYFSTGAGLPNIGRMSRPQSAKQFQIEEGMRNAELFLLTALNTAEDKGIRLPDLAAMRAGLSTPGTTAASNQSIDKTAVMLEYRLASIRERSGTNEALRGALAGYTRIYDALAGLVATNRAVKAEGSTSGQPDVRSDRLVRLATKVGDIHAQLGSRTAAERWLLRAISLAGAGTIDEQNFDDEGRQALFRNEILAGGTGQLSRVPAEAQEVEGTLQTASVQSHSGADSAPVGTPPSPGLTRSLISSLLSLSAFYAQPTDRSMLEQALQMQASALRLTRVEMGRLALSNKDDLGAQLHQLWLAHHDGLACVHVGETMYGLQAAAKGHSSLSGILSAVGLGGGGTAQKQGQTLAWLEEARGRAEGVLTQLAANAKTRRPSDKVELTSKWSGASIDIRTQADRLLRDAERLRTAIDDMKAILAANKG